MKTLREELLGEKCETCGEVKPDVYERPNAYANDVHNDSEAVHTVCDECAHQNAMDI